MKTLIPFLLLALFSCGPDQATLDRINSLSDKVATLESAQAVNFSRLDQLEQEQTFQYKDIDSTKRALVWLGAQVLRHDTIIASGKSGLIKSEKRAKSWGIFVRTLLGR
jgi:hypothetical protein